MAQIDWDTLGFDAYRTRTVVLAHYRDGAWSDIQTTETFSFTIDPFTQGLHYAISCFEGLKAFRQKDGGIIMFRPEKNAARMARSARFLGLPEPPQEMFIKMCELCVKNNLEFLPPYGHQASLYLRPLLFAPHPQMQLVPYPEVILAVMCAPAGSYKLSANYAGTFVPYQIAHQQGYAELLYLNSATREYVDEFGSSNFFGIKDNTYVTPLSDSVLPSITNLTLQECAADFGMKVEKRRVPLEELAEFEEAGGCGTAVVITPMSHIDMKPVLREPAVSRSFRYEEDGAVGPVCTKLYKRITGIQFGEIEDVHGWCYKI